MENERIELSVGKWNTLKVNREDGSKSVTPVDSKYLLTLLGEGWYVVARCEQSDRTTIIYGRKGGKK